MSKRAVCPCPYCDPMLWTQAHCAAGKKANVIGLLARLVEQAIHPENFEEGDAP